MDPDNLARLRAADEVKLVVASREDFEEARELVRGPLASFEGSILLGAVHERLAPGRLAEWILEERLPVRLQTQLHKQLWPGEERGV